MNLLVSYQWLQEYVSLSDRVEDVAARLSLSGPGVERLYPQGLELDNIVVGHVIKITAHPAADKLRVASVDVGKKPLTIVCGGSNLVEDQWVAVALLGAKVKWHGEGDVIALALSDIRGVPSEGMICAASEIGLAAAFPHAEREILDLKKELPGVNLAAGMPLAATLGCQGDVVMDVEVTTNRPDAMGMVGMAREVAAILDRPFLWRPAPEISTTLAASDGPLSVRVSDTQGCLRYQAVRIDGVTVGPSPWWLKRRLLSAGIRPINNVVDITNYVMLELGQPMHVFDAAQVSQGAIRVRQAKAGEQLLALDGKEYVLEAGMLVIADDQRPLAIAGIMGGERSGATAATTSIIFEAATFDPVRVRRASRALNLTSDSQLRFEKGLSTQAPPLAMARAVQLCLALAGGQVGKMVDRSARNYRPSRYAIKTSQVTAMVGVPLTLDVMTKTLARLGFGVTATKRTIAATVPWWRDHDIESGRDLIEEIARVYGYGNIPAVFPAGISLRPQAPELLWEDRLRTSAKEMGLTETYTYSFVSRQLLEQAGYDADRCLRVQNPLTADFEFMRTTLLPSLLQVIRDNQERYPKQQLFEIAHVYYPQDADWKRLPDEQLEFAAAFLGGETLWKQAKGCAETAFAACGLTDVAWRRLDQDPFWHPGRSAQAFLGDVLIGTIGELHPAIQARLKLDGAVGLVDLPLESIFRFARAAKPYAPIAAFPEAKRDLACTLPRDVEVQRMIPIMQAASPLLRRAEWFDTYRGSQLGTQTKSVAFHLTFAAADRTLAADEVETALQAVRQKLAETFNAQIRQ